MRVLVLGRRRRRRRQGAIVLFNIVLQGAQQTQAVVELRKGNENHIGSALDERLLNLGVAVLTNNRFETNCGGSTFDLQYNLFRPCRSWGFRGGARVGSKNLPYSSSSFFLRFIMSRCNGFTSHYFGTQSQKKSHACTLWFVFFFFLILFLSLGSHWQLHHGIFLDAVSIIRALFARCCSLCAPCWCNERRCINKKNDVREKKS